MTHVLLFNLCIIVASVFLTFLLRRYALKALWLDHPNARSSHTVPTPRGGGLSIVVTSSAAILVLIILRRVNLQLGAALLGGGIAIAIVGFLDDRRSISVRIRITVHALAALWGLYCLGGVPPLRVGGELLDLGSLGDFLGLVAVVWILNLFNFMDGIDGIAASEAVFVTAAGAIVGLAGGASSGTSVAALVVASASIGFLAWNWPPAKIFMGDVGSAYLGYVIAILALAASRESSVGLFVWLILGAVFFVDATVTLARRLLKGERIHEAHRSHAYQILARRWRSHRLVTITVISVNVLVLLPLAWIATSFPRWAAAIAALVLIALAIEVWILGDDRNAAAWD